MPNIEIHGMSQEEASVLKRKIFNEYFPPKFWIFDVVITFCPTDVRDLSQTSRPYLRIWSSSEDYFLDELIKILKQWVRMDIELPVRLAEFVPLKSARLSDLEVFAEIWRRPNGVTAKVLALALADSRPTPWLRSILRKLVRHGFVQERSRLREPLYTGTFRGLDHYLSLATSSNK